MSTNSNSNINLNTNMAEYYAKRADQHDNVYARPERQADLPVVRDWLQQAVAGQRVLEIACGTGYWTAEAVKTAEHVLATDINADVIAIARARNLPADKVDFALADAFAIETDQPFTACLAGFWWSHVLREQQDSFMERLREQLGKDTLVVMMDNVYVEGISTSIARTDLLGNTFQIRRLGSGERYEVVKNFPSDSGLRKRLSPHLKDIRIQRIEHYWMLTGRLK
ncbi:class I SAM-dependent methyltransferase [Actimicrobium sp. CCI2.3]|uniref:class I SAM-dependent methyltransferase n=1 Tax=Actimicrobium sp. CCI2.3 TaxID=3048616 RepID=UPI002AB37115|nr:methyltransferase domain-containing protein [Actimicrobium sp. CCI2.3]MDY7574143.1 methyltransferase domain-containing protein [Actimicrobium sp. CCI2.3]MEB0023273.1 methyltransferase domain-containing protein [Actimicrobium sp. CCI2.3]